MTKCILKLKNPKRNNSAFNLQLVQCCYKTYPLNQKGSLLLFEIHYEFPFPCFGLVGFFNVSSVITFFKKRVTLPCYHPSNCLVKPPTPRSLYSKEFKISWSPLNWTWLIIDPIFQQVSLQQSLGLQNLGANLIHLILQWWTIYMHRTYQLVAHTIDLIKYVYCQ